MKMCHLSEFVSHYKSGNLIQKELISTLFDKKTYLLPTVQITLLLFLKSLVCNLYIAQFISMKFNRIGFMKKAPVKKTMAVSMPVITPCVAIYGVL